MTESKACRKCGEVKPLTEFSRRKQNPDGLQTRCRPCDSLYQRAARKKRMGTLNVGDTYRFTCGHCNQPQVATYTSGQRKRYCEPCYALRVRKYARSKYREYDLRKKYGITEADYDDMLRRQGGRCAICKDTDARNRHGTDRFSVDHDHESGHVRALLCGSCNSAIGLLQDDPKVIEAAAKYVRAHRQIRAIV